MKIYSAFLIVSVLAAIICGPVAAETGSERPNVVLILSDDQGFPDYGFMGHPIVKTPRLDKLAGEGMVFTRGYVTTALCCPSLATILTGQYPHQHGYTGNNPVGKKDRSPWLKQFFLQPQFPALLKEAGYRTLQTGKYWFGQPEKSGFTDSMGHTGRHGGSALAIGRKTMQPIEDFIAKASKDHKPFFVWYAPMMPHLPHNAPNRLLEKYKNKGIEPTAAKYYAMIEWFDETCGQLLDCLDKNGVRENTIVLFLSDNGWKATDTGSLGSGAAKVSPWDLGVRQPIIIRWPARVKPVRDETHLASNIDLAPTILSACGVRPPDQMKGVDLLDSKAVAARKAIFLEQFTHDMVDVALPEKALQSRGVVSGEWKLLLANQPDPSATRPGKPMAEKVMLFNILADPMEHKNLAAKNPKKVKELTALMDAWWNPKQSSARSASNGNAK